jgi:hypothetical protein
MLLALKWTHNSLFSPAFKYACRIKKPYDTA